MESENLQVSKTIVNTRQVLDSIEASKYLGISYWLIRKLVREKQIPHFKIASKTLFTKEILDQYIQDSLEKVETKEEKRKKLTLENF